MLETWTVKKVQFYFSKEQFNKFDSFIWIPELNQVIIKFQIMYSNNEKTNSQSTDNDNLKSSQNNYKKKGFDKDKESKFDIEREMMPATKTGL